MKKEKIEKIIRLKKDLDKCLDVLAEVFGCCTGPLFDTCYAIFENWIAEIDDENGWLNWFIYDNDCGERGLDAGFDNELKPICNVDDFMELMQNKKDRCDR